LPAAEGGARQRGGQLLGEAALAIYAAAGIVAWPAAAFLLARRRRRGKEDAERQGERYGRTVLSRPTGPLVWVHAASVGETVAALPLIERLAAKNTVLLTTATVTAARIAESRLPAGAVHQYAPIDFHSTVRRFLDHWRPDLVLFAESELWPTTLRAVSESGIPLALVNARMSDRSFRLWRAASPIAAAVLGRVDLFLAQSPIDGERLRRLGARNIVVCGNLKLDSPPPPADQIELARLRTAIGRRRVLLAASTHPGEEDRLIACHASLRERMSDVLTILAPRHPERGEALAALIAAKGLAFSQRSRRDPIARATDILLADTIGEMGLWYRLANVAFLGGSLMPRGSQSPIEAAKLKAPIVHGANIGGFGDIYAALTAANAAKVVTEATLETTLVELIADPLERTRMADAAFACVAGLAGALDRTMTALQPYLLRIGDRHAAAARA
jgi:3-deoxy-D-manno-octulosonic-acid transferase